MRSEPGSVRGVSRGIERERKVRALLGAEGYWTCRAAGSFGDADVVALKAGATPRMIEVKSTTRSPFADFGPADRKALSDAARLAGAVAQLCWWPPRKQPRWIEEADWPPIRGTM